MAAITGRRSRAIRGCFGIVGKIGVAVSGGDGNRVYAIVENENGGVSRPTTRAPRGSGVSEDRRLRQRAFYTRGSMPIRRPRTRSMR